MINMKMSKEEAKEYTSAPSTANAPAYPYGLCLCMDDDALAKLGYTDPPAVGTQLELRALVTVTGIRSSQQQDGDKESGCDLQITDMELADAQKTGAQRLYKDMNP